MKGGNNKGNETKHSLAQATGKVSQDLSWVLGHVSTGHVYEDSARGLSPPQEWGLQRDRGSLDLT